MKPGMKIEVEGGVGELDYGGVTLNALDFIIGQIAEHVVAPEVKRHINRVTGETEASVKVERMGWFNPKGTIEPAYRVETDIYHAQILEYAYNGRNAFMRPAAKSRRMKTGIRNMIKLRFGEHMTAQVRNFRRKRKK